MAAAVLEFANAKCRWAVYFGYWPEWADDIVIPTDADVDLLIRQWAVAMNNGRFETVKKRCARAKDEE